MNSTIINLQGNFSAELGSEFYLSVRDLLRDPYLLLLDGSGILDLDPIGVGFLQKAIHKAKESKSHLAVVGLPIRIQEKWVGEGLGEGIPIFRSRSEGIQYLEGFLPIEEKQMSPAGDSPRSTGPKSGAVSAVLPGDVLAETYCPHCRIPVRIQKYGDQICGSCGGKFYFQKNHRRSKYEKL